jgi:hypothetical protein
MKIQTIIIQRSVISLSRNSNKLFSTFVDINIFNLGHYASTSSDLTSPKEHSKKFGYGPPFLFALPEPIKSPWKRLNSPNFRKSARPIAGNALRRVERKRKHNPALANGNFGFNFPEEDTDIAENNENYDNKVIFDNYNYNYNSFYNDIKTTNITF